jgi:hypothetical protein
MKFQRGLFRMWIVVSAAWVLIVGSIDRVDCAFGDLSALWCHGYGRDPYVWASAWPILVRVFGVPLAVLIAGAGLLWAARGFRSN